MSRPIQPAGAAQEDWVSVDFTVPSTMNQIRVGVLWNTIVAIRETYYINKIELYKLNGAHGNSVFVPSELVYEYHLKDHLGNVRTTFTTKEEVEEAVATLESEYENTERSEFIKYDDTRRVFDVLFDHAKGDRLSVPSNTPGYSIRLNGSANERNGIARSMSVMPGDKIDMQVFGKFIDPNTPHTDQTAWDNLAAFALEVAHAAQTVVIDGVGYTSGTLRVPPYKGVLTDPDESALFPKAHLNWVTFDRDWKFLDGGAKQLKGGAENGTDVAFGEINSSIEIKEPGYVYIWLSNTSATEIDVYFDDFKVTHTKSPVVATDEYYPFGLTFNSYQRENSLANQYLYNGKEIQDELNLGLYDYIARQYDPVLGRFTSIDPAAGLMRRYSPYSYAFDNPMRFTDPDGMVPGDFLNEKGQNIGNDGRNDGKVYVIKTTEKKFDSGVASAGITKDQAKQTEAYIKENSGNTAAFGEGNIANTNSVEIEGSATNRQAMVNEVNQDNGKGGTDDANNREYGGETSVSGNSFTSATPGPVSDPTVNSEADITLPNFEEDTKSDTHSHPSGTKSVNNGDGTTTNGSFRQAPSPTDVANSGANSNYVFGRGNGTVYIYNNTGVQATIPQKYFVTPKR